MEEGKTEEKSGEKSGEKKEPEKENAEKESAGKEGAEKEKTEKQGADQEDAEKESDEIDIYLFSNGQMYSPPRKYHLRPDELEYWEATLGFLARSQYGSLHSAVELYELDGRKVEDPKHIRDCAVYVAVVPPDPFIYAGYDKYLVKASKSYERRFSKRVNGGPGEPSSTDDTHKNGANIPKLSQDFTPAHVPHSTLSVKDNELRPQYPSIRKSNEVRKSSLKGSSQKLTEKIKPATNQVSQRPNVPRKFNPRSSDPVAKKTYMSRKETPRNSSRINTMPGVSGNISSIDQSIDKAKSPYVPELYVCDHSSHKVNESLPVLVPNINKITIKKQGITNKVNTPTIRKTAKPIHKNTRKIGDSYNVAHNSLVDEIYQERADYPKDPINKPNILNDLPKRALEKQMSASSTILMSTADDKLQFTYEDRILEHNKIKPSTADKIQGPPINQLTFMTNTRASMVNISNPTSREYTSTDNKAAEHVDVIEQLKRRFSSLDADDTSKYTYKDGMSAVVPENNISAIEDTPILIVKNQGPETTHTSKIKESTSINNKQAKYDDVIEQLSRKYKISDVDETFKYTYNDRVSTVPENKMSVIEEIPIFIDKNEVPRTTQTRKLNTNQVSKIYPKKITELNKSSVKIETNTSKAGKITNELTKREATTKETKLKTEMKPNILLLDAIQKPVAKETKKTPKIESPINKIKVSTLEPVPMAQYIDTDTVDLMEENRINNNYTKYTSLPINESIVKINDASNTDSIVYDIKVPMLYPVPEKTIKYISNRRNLENEPAMDDKDITIKAIDPEATKTHSYTFVIKKDDNRNTVKVTNMNNTKDIQESTKVPIANIVKDKDIVHINIFRNSLSEGMPLKNDRAGVQNNEKQIKEKTNINKMETTKKNAVGKVSNVKSKNRNSVDSPSKIPLKETEIKTTFVNPVWEGNSTTIVHKTTSKDLIADEPTTNQFVEFVQSGDIVNLKLSIQIKNAEGNLKTTQRINMGKSNSVSQLENDDISKTPNELTRSKSLQSVEDDSPHLCCRKDKVVVYQCSCCTQSDGENTNYNFAANPLNRGQGFYVLLPVVMPAQGSGRAPCQICDKQVQHTESLIKASMNVTNKETLISVPGDGDKPTSIKLSNMSQNVKVDSSTKRPVLMGEEVMRSQLIMMRTDPSQTSSRYNVETKQQQTNTLTQDQYTQTDWCNVLLEARAEPDGHFTFYLPPLDLLQQYTLR